MGFSAKTEKFLMGGSKEPQRCTFWGPKVTILSGINRIQFFFKQMMKYDIGGCGAHIWGGLIWRGGSWFWG